ncbi:MAG TPA: heme peroxidase family protein [Actinophytocola sp.]|uniref:peroxidase family protein n=1 Tax=Actinophytocola sp. TaxID=1872138 RepID=UPI002DDD1D09|nr:heme peroxidase family protein [Actinophytocola sp.]HEV2780155.1 heme peroxidase family protein [Actinophytocola sp.]
MSRRGFLAGLTASAGAVALAPAEALANVITDAAGGLATSPDRFGRIFALPGFADFNASGLRPALMAMGQRGGVIDARDPLEVGPVRLITEPGLSPNNLDNPAHTAGMTFLGQFIDHDVTFDQTSPLGVVTAPENSPNTRTPALDLDSVYGRGPAVDPQLYNSADRDKFRVDSGGLFEDLPRQSNGTAIIADPRNDENLMIAGMHAAFLLFHNRVVDRLRGQGQTNVFAAAQQLVRWHYQWIVVHQFLPAMIGQAVVDDILRNGRRIYRPAAGQQFIPVEFQGACYRFGHSMVRPSYRANLQGDPGGNPATGAPAFFGFIFDPAGEGQADPVDLRGGARARRRFIGWQTFFDFGGDQTQHVRNAKRIDTKISTPLFNLPLAAIPSRDAPTSLAQRNLLRHITWSIPSGQAIAQAMGIQPLWAQNFPELQQFAHGLPSSTPLWYYILKEAELLAGGQRLAGVGARIVGEVFIGLLQLDPTSYLATNPNWRPTLPRRDPNQPVGSDFTMTDLLTFARVDPTSRGQ